MGDRNPSSVKREFAQWMRSQLGYQASETNVPVGHQTGIRRRVIGIRGEMYGLAWQRLRSVAFVAFAVAAVLRTVVSVPDGEAPVLPNILLGLSVVAYVAAYLGRLRTRHYAWVECKDIKRRLSREDIRTLHDAVQQVRADKAAKWKPAQILVVAGANGFEHEALAFAKSLGIECYRRTESGFERAS